MRDKIPKKALDEYYELNELEMMEIEKSKKEYNKTAMQNEEQKNALLQLKVQELEIELENVNKQKKSFQTSFFDEKKRNEELIQSMKEYKELVDTHLKNVINELEKFDNENASFLETLATRLKIKRLKKKTDIFIKDSKSKELNHETQEC